MTLINCSVCCKHRAAKICKDCPIDKALLCVHCSLSIHTREADHAPKPVCVDCFAHETKMTCETCGGGVCKGCTPAHMALCVDEEDKQSTEDRSDVSDGASASESESELEDESDDDFEPVKRPSKPLSNHNAKAASPAKPTQAPPAKPKTPRKPRASKGAKTKAKVAEVVEAEADDPGRTARTAAVSDTVMQRIRKALALGLHEGGNTAEKTHAMQRATRLMQQHGLSQSDIKDKDEDLAASCAVVAVRLNGLHQRWPGWGATLGNVAANMSNVRWYYTYSRKPNPMTVTFYGLKAEALMGATVFEEAYNLVLAKGEATYGGRGKAASILDYRLGLSNGLYSITKADKQAREAAIAEAKARMFAPPSVIVKKESTATTGPPLATGAAVPPIKSEPGVHVKSEPGAGHLPAATPGIKRESCENDSMASSPWDDAKDGPEGVVKDEPVESQWGKGVPATHQRGASAGAGGSGRGHDFGADDDGGYSCGGSGYGAGSWEDEWAKGYAGDSGVAANPHALVLYQDKAAAAMDTHEKAVKIKKGRKKPKRTLKDAAAYNHGKRDAETVALGTKKLKSAA